MKPIKKVSKFVGNGVCKDCKRYKPGRCTLEDVPAGPQDFCIKGFIKKEGKG
jgi:hypothetical protein